MSHDDGDLELIDFTEGASGTRRRRRRRRAKKHTDENTELLMSASGVLSAAALGAGDLGDIDSSPASSVPMSPRERKLSVLELDDISEEPALMTSSTWTPASLDSSRSIWELGSIEADEDEILSLRDFSKSPVIPSLRMKQGLEDAYPKEPSLSITAQIETVLNSLKSAADGQTHRFSRLCLPNDQSNRLCMDPSFVPPQVRDWLNIAQTSWETFSNFVATTLQPDSVNELVAKLNPSEGSSSTGVTKDRVPIINRRQRRAFNEK